MILLGWIDFVAKKFVDDSIVYTENSRESEEKLFKFLDIKEWLKWIAFK